MHDAAGASIVTGGGRGIGKAITLRLARDSAVVPVGRTQADLDATCESVRTAGGKAISCPGDVAEPATAERAVQIARDMTSDFRRHADLLAELWRRSWRRSV
jgi:NAD(P)-dependent dehydrogenase (short-subunit alcohol dehydrogenase family)